MISIKRITTSDPLYQQERELRNRILLRPIGIPDFGWEMNDDKSWHFVAVKGQKVLGCVILVPQDDKSDKAQLIQMAVESTWQGKGLGRLLVLALIKFAKQIQLSEIVIHSRSNITSFYEHLGFEIFGEEFEEVGIKHRYMRMALIP